MAAPGYKTTTNPIEDVRKKKTTPGVTQVGAAGGSMMGGPPIVQPAPTMAPPTPAPKPAIGHPAPTAGAAGPVMSSPLPATLPQTIGAAGGSMMTGFHGLLKERMGGGTPALPGNNAMERAGGVAGGGSPQMAPPTPAAPGGGNFFTNSPRGQMGEEAFRRSQEEYLKSPEARIPMTVGGAGGGIRELVRKATGGQPQMAPPTPAPPMHAKSLGGRGILTSQVPSAGGSSPPRDLGVPGAAVTQFGPSGDLRDDQVLPGKGADRYKIAQGRYDQFLEDAAPGEFDAVRMVGQRAAAGGRLFSGMEQRNYADTGRAIEQARGSARNRFLQDALEGTIGDERQNRDEIRTERGYQSDAAQTSIGNRRQQALDEDYLEGTQFDRDYRHTGQLADIGYRGNPADAILSGASQTQGAADSSGDALAEFARRYAYGRSVDPNLDQYGRPKAPPAGNEWGGAAKRPATFGVPY